jgi:antitoxin ParD1/3/4
MPSTHQFNIILPRDMAEQVERQVESGAYANVSEVVREGIELLLDREIPLEKWLREEVLESIKEYEADPTSAIPADEIMDPSSYHGLRNEISEASQESQAVIVRRVEYSNRANRQLAELCWPTAGASLC